MANQSNIFSGPRGKHIAPAGTVVGHTHAPSREIEHGQTQGLGMARAGGKPKASGDIPIHGGMTRTSGTNSGAPVTATLGTAEATAAEANVLSPSRVGKKFPAPRPAHGQGSRPLRATYDPTLGDAIMAEAHAAGGSDHFDRSVGRLPGAVSEEK